jgi:hypothetical protein
MQLLDFLGITPKTDDIVIEFRPIRGCCQFGTRNAAQWMQGRNIIQSLEQLVRDPHTNECQNIAGAQNRCICRQWHCLSRRHGGSGRGELCSSALHAQGKTIFILFSILRRGNLSAIVAYWVKGLPKHVWNLDPCSRCACALAKGPFTARDSRAAVTWWRSGSEALKSFM